MNAHTNNPYPIKVVWGFSPHRGLVSPWVVVLGGYIKNRKLAVVNQGPRQSDDQMSGKRVRGIRCLKTTLVARSDRQCANVVRGQN